MLAMVDKEASATDEPPLVTIRRGEETITEWSQNGDLIAAAFPRLFMRGGRCLPHGTWPTGLTKQLMCYYDWRFEKKQNTGLVATLFNQL